jgi:hypothetical protein
VSVASSAAERILNSRDQPVGIAAKTLVPDTQPLTVDKTNEAKPPLAVHHQESSAP